MLRQQKKKIRLILGTSLTPGFEMCSSWQLSGKWVYGLVYMDEWKTFRISS